jgi:hypothetical protein
LFLSVLFLTISSLGAAAEYSVAPVAELPEGVSPNIAKTLATSGQQVTGPDGPLCSLWLAKSLAVKDGFSATLSVKYALVPGSFVGLLRVDEGTEFTDFREQVIEPGLYTLRYGQQPEDGNHIGTSDLADFLLALPAKEDKSPGAIDDTDELSALSTEAAGSTHPAILALRPAEGVKPGDPQMSHDAADDLWILETTSSGDKPVVLRLVVVGFALE